MNRVRIAAAVSVLVLLVAGAWYLRFPIGKMPRPAQWLTLPNPLRYYLAILRGIFLKGTGVRVLWPQMAALLLLGGATMAIAIRQFRKTLS